MQKRLQHAVAIEHLYQQIAKCKTHLYHMISMYGKSQSSLKPIDRYTSNLTPIQMPVLKPLVEGPVILPGTTISDDFDSDSDDSDSDW
jgi:hypothetical protein